MIGPRTLQQRLALTALVFATVWVVLITAVFNLLLVRRLDAQAEDVLRTRVAAAASTVTARSDGTLVIADSPGDVALDSGIWVFEGSTAVERAPGPISLQALAVRLVGTDGTIIEADDPYPVELLSRAVRADRTQVGTVVAVISLEPYERSTRNTLVASVLLAVLLLVFVYVLTRLVIRRALAPVAEMTRQAGEWSAGDTSLRFGIGSRPGELEELAGNLDGLLDRLSAVLRREQQLSAEISHELRTPLAGITAEAELFTSRPRSGEEARTAMNSVAEGARRMERILETLLTAARAEALTATGRCDAVAVARETAVPVEVTGMVPWVGADEAVVERVLAPLLENARRYAATDVRIRVSADAQAVLLEILDDGPGVPAGAEEAVFDPGRRMNPSDGHDGAGLGLTLARRLARAAGGDLTCTAGPGGRFVVRLPRA